VNQALFAELLSRVEGDALESTMRRAVERGVMRTEEHGKKSGFVINQTHDEVRTILGEFDRLNGEVRQVAALPPPPSSELAALPAAADPTPETQPAPEAAATAVVHASALAGDGRRARRRGGQGQRRPRRERLPTEPRLLEVLARQTVSNFGNSVTQFALPLIVFKLTGSALALAPRSPYTPRRSCSSASRSARDRSHRPQALMIVVDLLSAVTIASVPSRPGWASLALVDLRRRVRLVDALDFLLRRGVRRDPEPRRFQRARYRQRPDPGELRRRVGARPLAAGTLLSSRRSRRSCCWMPRHSSSRRRCCRHRAPFNAPITKRATSIRQDIVEGLRYVLSHPVLRNISLMMALITSSM